MRMGERLRRRVGAPFWQKMFKRLGPKIEKNEKAVQTSCVHGSWLRSKKEAVLIIVAPSNQFTWNLTGGFGRPCSF